MTDDSECFVPSNYIKNPENQEQKLKKNNSKLAALMENSTV